MDRLEKQVKGGRCVGVFKFGTCFTGFKVKINKG